MNKEVDVNIRKQKEEFKCDDCDRKNGTTKVKSQRSCIYVFLTLTTVHVLYQHLHYFKVPHSVPCLEKF